MGINHPNSAQDTIWKAWNRHSRTILRRLESDEGNQIEITDNYTPQD
jgi:hypothetical protein